mmetsp:Transcript_35624/g.83328  ORF Transcript_35624/g.83328 Transcript_35624/m.83328 type:complete len:377 (-) Transcript_35624:296-1426(-)
MSSWSSLFSETPVLRHRDHVDVMLPEKLVNEAVQLLVLQNVIDNPFLDECIVNVELEHDKVILPCNRLHVEQGTHFLGGVNLCRSIEPVVDRSSLSRHLPEDFLRIVCCDFPHPEAIELHTLVPVGSIKPTLRSASRARRPCACPSIKVVVLALQVIVPMDRPLIHHKPILPQKIVAKVLAASRMAQYACQWLDEAISDLLGAFVDILEPGENFWIEDLRGVYLALLAIAHRPRSFVRNHHGRIGTCLCVSVKPLAKQSAVGGLADILAWSPKIVHALPPGLFQFGWYIPDKIPSASFSVLAHRATRSRLWIQHRGGRIFSPSRHSPPPSAMSSCSSGRGSGLDCGAARPFGIFYSTGKLSLGIRHCCGQPGLGLC